MSTMTQDLYGSELLSRAFQRLQSFGLRLSAPMPNLPEASAELLRLAAQYDETQPSYAADLRAAALASERDVAEAV